MRITPAFAIMLILNVSAVSALGVPGTLGELVTGTAAALSMMGAGSRWIYRRGQAAGRAEIQRENDQRAMAEIRTRLDRLEGDTRRSWFGRKRR
jgi:hypothetical protein